MIRGYGFPTSGRGFDATVRQHRESRKSKRRPWTNGPAYCRVLEASEAESAPRDEGTLYVRSRETSLCRW